MSGPDASRGQRAGGATQLALPPATRSLGVDDPTPRVSGLPIDSPCVEASGWRDRDGYVHVRVGGGRRLLAHRIAWRLVHGPIPAGMLVCHHCDHPPCINVSHLFLGTNADNQRDRWAKGHVGVNRGEHAGTSKLSALEVAAIRARYDRGGDRHRRGGTTQAALAAEYGIAQCTVSDIVRGRRWGHVELGEVET